MYRMFGGATRILGVRDGKLNCKGFEGPERSVERGTPGFVPDSASGREVPVVSLEGELTEALAPFGVEVADLSDEVRSTILDRRQAFTLVEGVAPRDVWRGRIDVDELVRKTIRHEQSTLAIQQLGVLAIHNGEPLADGKPLRLPDIPPTRV